VPDVFLTGGTGFIGSALLSRLLTEGRSVRALVRSESDAGALGGRGVEPVVADIETPESLDMRGCRTVFHVAGLNAMCLRDPSALERVNVAGTLAMVRAAARDGVERFVYTSSAATIGEPEGVVGSEATRHRGSYVTSYERSKHLAEIAAMKEAADLGLDLVAVNPSSVQGPGRTGGTAKILIAYLSGRLRYAIDTRMSLVFIDDVVEAHLEAEAKGVAGERYLVSGWTTTVRHAVAEMASSVGEQRPVRYLPAWPVQIAAVAAGAWARLRRRDALLCSEMVRALRHGHAYDGSRVEREWGFEYTPPEQWLAKTIEWYRTEGLIGE
jgi:dihydroflavonol-4-reductase